jgi:hypothetical protein
MTERDDNDIQDVLDTLSTLAPTASDAPRPAAQALARISQQTAPRKRGAVSWRLTPMSKRQYALAALLVLLVFAALLSFPSVRAAASDFLGLFRVQKFAALSISPEQLAKLEDISGMGLYPGEIEMIEQPGEPQVVASVAEAEELSGQQLLGSRRLGKPDQIYVTDGGRGRLTINVASSRALLEAVGADPSLIPDSLEGAPVDVQVFASASQTWEEQAVALTQTNSPVVEYPEDVDPAALGAAVLEALGMEADEAARLANSIDWTSTLLVPVPENVATFSEVDVNGADGLALSSLDASTSALLWQRAGVVYVLTGTDVEELLDIAQSLR